MEEESLARGEKLGCERVRLIFPVKQSSLHQLYSGGENSFLVFCELHSPNATLRENNNHNNYK